MNYTHIMDYISKLLILFAKLFGIPYIYNTPQSHKLGIG